MPFTTGLIPRTLVQAIPSSTPSITIGTLANGATLNKDFDCLKATADPALINVGVSPSPNAIVAVGPFLDAFLFADQPLTLAVFYALNGGTFRQVSNTLVGLSTFANISGLRITGHFVRVQLSNASGSLANIEFGAFVRST